MNDKKYNEILSTRGCFDIASDEYTKLDMSKKVELLKELINQENFTTAELSIKMMDTYNKEFNKEIRPIDLVLGLSSLVDYLLKEDNICK